MWFPEKVTGNMEFVTVAKMQGGMFPNFLLQSEASPEKTRFGLKQ